MNYETEIKEIENSKDRVAWAIAMSVCNGNESKARECYPRFLEDLKNTSVFFLKVSSFETRYTIERKAVIKELSKLVGYDTLPYIDKQCAMAKRNFFKGVSDEFISFYNRTAKKYGKYGVGYEAIEKLYHEGRIKELDEKIANIDKYQAYRFIRESASNKNEVKELDIVGKQFDEIKAKFKVSTLEDLLFMGIEMESFFIDTSNKSELQKKIIERNKDSFRKRMGVGKDYNLDKETFEALQNQINQIYNFNLYRQSLDNSNLKDFFDYYGYEYNGHNLKHTVGMLMSVLPAAAICGTHNLGDDKNKHCMYGAFILDKPTYNQNMVVTHESVHALERVCGEGKPFWRSYCSINEAMTEYFALRAQQYLKGNVMESHNNNPDGEYSCAYTNMLSLVEVLEKSPYWNDFLEAKFNGKNEELIQKVGRNNMRKIRDLFISCNCLETIDTYSQKHYAETLEKLINKIYLRRNK